MAAAPAETLAPDGALVVVGAGLGGLTLVERLRAGGHEGPVTLVGAEDLLPYDRPPLSKEALRDGAGPSWLRPPQEYRPLHLDVRLGRSAVRLDTADRRLLLDDGEELGYDALVLAPGAAPRRLAALAAHPAAHVLRTHADATALRADVVRAGRLVVVGAGFIGCEVASSARALGVEVDVVEVLPGPLVRVLGPQLAERMARLHAEHGVRLRTSVSVTGVDGPALHLSDGSVLPAPVVLLGLGVEPATGWLAGADLALEPDGGVLCDGCGRTSAPGVWALGDAASWQRPGGAHRRVEHWTSAVEQADGVATALRDDAAPAHAPVPYFWSEQHGVLLQSVGEVDPSTEVELHAAGGSTVALHARDGLLLGAVVLDAKRLVGRTRRLLRDGASLEQARSALLR